RWNRFPLFKLFCRRLHRLFRQLLVGLGNIADRLVHIGRVDGADLLFRPNPFAADDQVVLPAQLGPNGFQGLFKSPTVLFLGEIRERLVPKINDHFTPPLIWLGKSADRPFSAERKTASCLRPKVLPAARSPPEKFHRAPVLPYFNPRFFSSSNEESPTRPYYF